jgi:hypothetical protein
MTPDEYKLVKETRDRSVRIETRVTKLLKIMECETKTQAARFNSRGQFVLVPSRDISLTDILAAVPEEQKEFDVVVGTDLVCTIVR